LRLKAMSEACRKASSKEEKEKIRADIKKALSDEFNKKMASGKKHLDEVEKRLKELREKFEERKKKAEEIIERKLDDLTRDPTLNW